MSIWHTGSYYYNAIFGPRSGILVSGIFRIQTSDSITWFWIVTEVLVVEVRDASLKSVAGGQIFSLISMLGQKANKFLRGRDRRCLPLFPLEISIVRKEKQ